jgi:hypothetical protein
MSICTIHPPFQVDGLISERATRRPAAHPRLAAPVDAPTSLAGSADSDTSAPAAHVQILRRWSIAELIAAAGRRQEVA